MATLSSMVDTFPHPLKMRYLGADGAGTQWVSWLNDGLFELEREDLLPEITYETGVEVENDVWVTPPSGYRRGIEMYVAEQPSIKVAFSEIQGKLKIVNDMTFDQEPDPETFSAVSAQAVGSVTLDVDDRTEDDLENYLIVVTAGLLAGNTFILSGNDASAGGTTKVYFLHDLSAAWDPADVSAGNLIDPSYYMVLKYTGYYTPITAITDEIPVGPRFETSLKSWLLWKAHERVRHVSNETQYHERQWQRQLESIRGERLRLNRTRTIRGRRLHGMEQRLRNRYVCWHENDSE